MADPKVILWITKRFFYKGDGIKVGIEFGLLSLVNFVKKNSYLFDNFFDRIGSTIAVKSG